jgi:thioredoxin-dependent peroxiredoxin
MQHIYDIKESERIMALLKVGEAAPDFAVKDNTGKDVRLSDYIGKTVVLWFYPKADTPG